MSKRALITGITGQDGSYLAELLLEKGYEVVGAVRRSSSPNFWRIEHLLDRIQLRPADLLDQLSLIRLLADVEPDEVYNLAAMSFVPASWDQPLLTGEFRRCARSTRASACIRHRRARCTARCAKCRRPS
jgi:GDPmannose 4,6-dehydratase